MFPCGLRVCQAMHGGGKGKNRGSSKSVEDSMRASVHPLWVFFLLPLVSRRFQRSRVCIGCVFTCLFVATQGQGESETTK